MIECQKKRHAVLAIAIEDQIDYWFQSESGNVIELQRPIDGRSELPKFVRELIPSLLDELSTYMPDMKLTDILNSVGSTVISVPGVIGGNAELLQLPNWGAGRSRRDDAIKWNHRGRIDKPFKFAAEIGSNLESHLKEHGEDWSQSEREAFEATVFVVNDATASAVAEFGKRQSKNPSADTHDLADFVYVKIHGGVNVGAVDITRDGRVKVRPDHPEAGHIYCPSHPLDDFLNFSGVCNFHDWCLEGMIAVASLQVRAETWGRRQQMTFQIGQSESERQERRNQHEQFEHALKSWRKELKRLNPPGSAPTPLDVQLFESVINGQGIQHDVGIDLIAYYAGLLIYQLMVGIRSPAQVVLGGRMSAQPLLAAIRESVLTWARGYPQRSQLTVDGICDCVVSENVDQSERTVEVEGAMWLGRSRIGV